MKPIRILIPALLSSASQRTAQDLPRQHTLTYVKKIAKTKTVRHQTTLRPLVLPNVAAITKAMWKVDRKTLSHQLRTSDNVIRFWHGRGNWIRAPRHDKCAEVPWHRSCTQARASLRLHTSLARVAETRLTRELPLTNDWRTAVHLVQRIYPGTESWMLGISDREGGWGPWVWYGGSRWRGYHIGNDFLGADTVGGWMQFRYSTFEPYWRAAQADLKRRGIIVPDFTMPPEGGPTEYAAWLSPLGQALTAGYMRYEEGTGVIGVFKLRHSLHKKAPVRGLLLVLTGVVGGSAACGTGCGGTCTPRPGVGDSPGVSHAWTTRTSAVPIASIPATAAAFLPPGSGRTAHPQPAR